MRKRTGEAVGGGEHVELLGDLVGRRVRRPPAWMAVGPMRVGLRSQRVSNRRLRDATGWCPRFPSRREGWSAVITEITGAVSVTTPHA